MGKKLTAEEIDKKVRENPNKGFDQCSNCQGIEVQGRMHPDNEELDFSSLICDECIEAEENGTSLVDQKFSKYLNTLEDQTAAGILREVVFSLPEEQRREAIIKHLPEDVMENDITYEVIGYIGASDYEGRNGTDLGDGYKSMEDAFNDAKELQDEYVVIKIQSSDREEIKLLGEVPQENKLWRVPVLRTGFASRTIDVMAKTEQEAIDLAIDEAGGHEFSENDAEYSAPDGAY